MPRSKHLDGEAFDDANGKRDPVVFDQAAREAGFLGFGSYPRSGFIHIDLGPARSPDRRRAPRQSRACCAATWSSAPQIA